MMFDSLGKAAVPNNIMSFNKANKQNSTFLSSGKMSFDYSASIDPSDIYPSVAKKNFLALKEEIASSEKEKNHKKEYIKISRLIDYNLSFPIDVVVEPDDEGFIARPFDLSMLYGYGDDEIEAVDNLKDEIESLYKDLMEDDDFTEDWLSIKQYFKKLLLND